MAEIKWLTNGMVDNNDSATTPLVSKATNKAVEAPSAAEK